jgi:hypothetical protein
MRELKPNKVMINSYKRLLKLHGAKNTKEMEEIRKKSTPFEVKHNISARFGLQKE